MTIINTTGTVTVTSGSTAVTGSGTNWVASGIAGGTLFVNGGAYPIASVNSNTSLTLAIAYVGTTQSGRPYAIAVEQAVLAQTTANANRLADLLDQINPLGTYTSFSSSLMANANADAWRAGLGLGTMATQNASAVAITGGTIQINAGTVGAPSLARTGDIDTGFWFPEPGAIALSSNGTEVLRTTSANALGVGVTAPTCRVDIAALTTSAPGLRVAGGGTKGTAVAQNGDIRVGAGGTADGYMAYNWGAGATVIGNSWNSASGNLLLETRNGSVQNLALYGTGGARFGGTVGIQSDPVSGVGLAVRNDLLAYSAALRLINGQNFGYGVGAEFAQPVVSGGAVVVTGSTVSAWESNNNASLRFSTMGGGTLSERLRIGPTGLLRAFAYGAGTLTTDAAGNITASSDERLKTDITAFSRGLDDITRITPISYRWSALSGLDQMTVYSGFSAQDVEAAIPEAVGAGADGYLSVDLRPIVAALVNAVKTLQMKNDELAARVAAMEAGS